MCEYLRPVVALEWLKACCTDMIMWMSSFSQEETLNMMTARNYQSWRCGRYGTVRHYTSHCMEITNALIAVHVTSHLRHYTVYTRRSLMQSMSHLFLARCMYVCTLRMLMKNTVQLVQQVHIHRCLIVHNAITIVNSAKVYVLANL